MEQRRDAICKATNQGKQAFKSLFDRFSNQSKEVEVKKYIQDTELEYVGQGDGRVVLLDKNGAYLNEDMSCVVKINKYGDTDHNRSEVENWKRFKDRIPDRLLRITDWGTNYRWLVQPYLDTDVTSEMLVDLEKDLLHSGLKAYDINKRNCARVQDRAVIIDYDQPIEEVDLDAMDVAERESLIEWKYS